MSAFLKANLHLIVELLLVAALLGPAMLSLLVGAKFRLRWASLLAFLLSAASGLPILALSSASHLKKVVLLLSLVALFVGGMGAWLGLKPASGPPVERIRRRKRKPRQ